MFAVEHEGGDFTGLRVVGTGEEMTAVDALGDRLM
jgi:hypothetical protein